MASRIFLDQELNSCPLDWQVDAYPLSYRGSPLGLAPGDEGRSWLAVTSCGKVGFSLEGFSQGEWLPFFLFFGLAEQLPGHLKFPDQGLNLHPLCPKLEPKAAGTPEGLGARAAWVVWRLDSLYPFSFAYSFWFSVDDCVIWFQFFFLSFFSYLIALTSTSTSVLGISHGCSHASFGNMLPLLFHHTTQWGCFLSSNDLGSD